jgi:hypothetical protein
MMKTEGTEGVRSEPQGGLREHQRSTRSGSRLQTRRRQRADRHSEHFDVWFERIGQYYDDVLVSLEYDKPAVTAVRALPDWARHWDDESGVWLIHPGYAERLADVLSSLGYTIGSGW